MQTTTMQYQHHEIKLIIPSFYCRAPKCHHRTQIQSKTLHLPALPSTVLLVEVLPMGSIYEDTEIAAKHFYAQTENMPLQKQGH